VRRRRDDRRRDGRRRDAGTATTTAIAVAATNVPADVQVLVGPTRGPLRFTLQSITSGTPPTPADIGALRRRVAVTVNVDPSALSGSARFGLALRAVSW
jgi:hypothetical protein